MNNGLPRQIKSVETSGNDQSSESAREIMRAYINRESQEPPNIPLAIALIMVTMLVGVYLATHWPLPPF